MAKHKDPNEDRERAISLALGAIEKQFGKGSIMRLGEGETALNKVPVVPSGSVGLNIALGIGGYPRGRIIEVYGPESSGKTTLTLHAIAEAQKANGVAAFIDAEHALDVTYAAKLGVNTSVENNCFQVSGVLDKRASWQELFQVKILVGGRPRKVVDILLGLDIRDI